MKTAFIFSGQGAQYIGMGKDLQSYESAKNVFKRADTALGFSISDIMFNGPIETLTETKYTQPAILTMSIAIYEILKEHGYQPDVVGGLSLGEYGALYAAGVFDLETAIKLVHKRGQIMESAAPDVETAMYAILGGTREQVTAACQSATGIAEISNYNCTGQLVIAGEKAAITEVVNTLKMEKVKAIPLKVSGAFHTTLLRDAGQQLGDMLANVQIEQPKLPVFTNVTGGYYPTNEQEIKATLAKQVYSPVYFEDELLQMATDGVTTFIEIGPKNTLTTFVKKTIKNATAQTTDTKENIENLLKGME